MLQQKERFGHLGWEVYHNEHAKKRLFVFKDLVGYGDAAKTEVLVIQVLRPFTKSRPNPEYSKTLAEKAKKLNEPYEVRRTIRDYDFEKWHFAKRYVVGTKERGILERVIMQFDVGMARDLAQAIINVCGKGAETRILGDPIGMNDKDLEEYGI